MDILFLQVIEINLSSMVPYVSGPKRPQDRVAVSSMKEDFQKCLDEKVMSRNLCVVRILSVVLLSKISFIF